MLRGDGGRRGSNREVASKRGERGDCGRMAGDERGEGIFDFEELLLLEREGRTGERVRADAATGMCFVPFMR